MTISSHRLSYRYDELCLFEALQSSPFGAALLQGPTRGRLSPLGLHAATANCASSRHSILRLRRSPSPRAYSRGIISHRLSCPCGELCLFEALQSSPFGATLLQGPTRGRNILVPSP